MRTYYEAVSRADLSQWVVHLTKPVGVQTAFDVLVSILREGQIRPAFKFIACYCPTGAACFYDVPPVLWDSLVKTNPSDREGYGLAVAKGPLWSVGGRPVIYTDKTEVAYWPEQERFRIVNTDLKVPPPVDWTHEREWRVRGALTLSAVTPGWWPVVQTRDDLSRLQAILGQSYEAYVIGEGKSVRL
jgi:hypothetical protein